MTIEHQPVLLKEVIENLNLSDGKFIVDGTVDGGGHARQIIKLIMPKGFFLGVDLDPYLLDKTKKAILKEFSWCARNIRFEHGNYKDMDRILEKNNLRNPDGILLDLGFSFYHIVSSLKGFSFLKEEKLDMRYDPNFGISAMEVVNLLDEKTLAEIIWKFGQERFSRQIAKAIVSARKKEKIYSTTQLVEIINSAVPSFYKKRKIHPSTKTFQALRIYVNKELENLEEFLFKVPKFIAPKARVAIISFHSLEDRIVKKAFNNFKKIGIAKIITKKPIVPTKNEIYQNPKSRSAKLRVIEFI